MIVNGNLFADEKVNREEEKNHFNDLYAGLKRYSRFLSKNKWDADDLAQETFLKVLQHYHPSDISSSLMNKIAYHHWIDIVRKRKRELVETLEDVTGKDEPFQSDRLFDTVKLLLDHLTPKQAVIFMLKEAFSYQAREIADLLGCSEMAVKSSLVRAKKRFEKDFSLKSVDSYWSKNDREWLFDLMYKSLQAEDPDILIDCISEIPSLAEVPKLTKPKHSVSPLNLFCMAA
jgi:RNA polymerase sigma factor (sigma-70 family)